MSAAQWKQLEQWTTASTSENLLRAGMFAAQTGHNINGLTLINQ